LVDGGILYHEAKPVLTNSQTAATPQLIQSKVYGKEAINAPKGNHTERRHLLIWSIKTPTAEEYMVFEVRDSKVIGRFICPNQNFRFLTAHYNQVV